MPFELEEDEDRLVIDFNKKEFKGYTTKKGFKEQIKKLKEVMK